MISALEKEPRPGQVDFTLAEATFSDHLPGKANAHLFIYLSFIVKQTPPWLLESSMSSKVRN